MARIRAWYDVDADAPEGTNNSDPSITRLTDGRFVVAWLAYESAGGNRVFWRVFNADGTPANAVQKIDRDPPDDDLQPFLYPEVVALPDGGFTIGYFDQDLSFAHRINGQYSAEYEYLTVGADLQVVSRTHGALNTFGGDITVLNDGSIARLECVRVEGPVDTYIEYRVNGVTVASHLDFFTSRVELVAFGDGYILLVTDNEDVRNPTSPATDYSVYAFVRTSTITADHVLSDRGAGDQMLPGTAQAKYESAIQLAGGSVVAVWRDANNDGGLPGEVGTGIRGKIIGTNGQPGAEFSINAAVAGDQSVVSLAALPGGGFVAAYTDSEGGYLRLRVFDANGVALNDASAVAQQQPGDFALTAISNTEVMVAFSGGSTSMARVDLRNYVDGTEAGETLAGSSWLDVLSGFGGNDLLLGGAGGDEMRGGLGDDTYEVDHASDQVIEAADEGRDRVVTAFLRYTLGDNVEDLTMTTFVGAKGTGNALANEIDGGDGDDLLSGLDGDDTLIGAQADRLEGGKGSDTYRVSSVDVVVREGREATPDNNDTVVASVDWRLGANVESLVLVDGALRGRGNSGDNVLTGNALANNLVGVNGADRIDGGGGDDTLLGGKQADTLIGGTGADRLEGDEGDDILDGGDDADTLIGGEGRDILTGGAGGDSFRFTAGDSSDRRAVADVIADFSRADGDRINLAAIDARLSTLDVNDAFVWIDKAAFTAEGQLRYRMLGGTTYIEGNNDDDLDADFIIAVTGTVSLQASDFAL